MISRVLPSFKKAFQALPIDIKKKAIRTYKTWKKNRFEKSLKFKRIHSTKPIYSVRIGLKWRALGLMQDKNTITWFWIGSHEEYNNLVKQVKK